MDPSSIPGFVGFLFCSVFCLFVLSHWPLTFLVQAFFGELHVLISSLEPIRTRFLTLRNLAVSHNRPAQITSDGLHVVCLIFIIKQKPR